MTRLSCLAIVAIGFLGALPANAQEARTWSSSDTFSVTPTWWNLELEQRISVGNYQTDLFSSGTAVGFGVGLLGAINLNHHWRIGGGVAFDFPLGADVTEAYAAVNTSFSSFDTTIGLRLTYEPLALSWMTLGVQVEGGVLVDHTVVESGGSEASDTSVLGVVSGMVQIGLYPHDAFEIGVRAGYRYLVGDRAALAQDDADDLHVPAGPYRDNGGIMVALYEALHF